MNYHKMLTYYISPELKEKGWESDETSVYVPWPFSKEDNQLYLKIQKTGKNYKYSCFSKDKNKILRSVIRNATIIDDLNGAGQRIDTNPMGGENQQFNHWEGISTPYNSLNCQTALYNSNSYKLNSMSYSPKV